MNFINDFIKEFFAVLAGGGFGILTVAFLSKKIIDLHIRKQVEKFKSILAIEQKINSEREIFVLNSQLEAIKEIWRKVIMICNECAKFEEDREELVIKIEELESCLEKNRIFMSKQIENIINQILETSNPEVYEGSDFNKLNSLKEELISEYRRYLSIEMK